MSSVWVEAESEYSRSSAKSNVLKSWFIWLRSQTWAVLRKCFWTAVANYLYLNDHQDNKARDLEDDEDEDADKDGEDETEGLE